MSHVSMRNPDEMTFRILLAISTGHLLNDTIQSLIPSLYPILKQSYFLSFTEIGAITMTWQVTASILQPLVGLAADRRSRPFSLALGMTSTLIGLVIIAFASSFPTLLFGVAFVGIGSAIFHPEASRVARMASGGQHGFAQSLFQVGGNIGSAIGPLLAAFIILPSGQRAVIYFALLALIAIILLTRVGFWYRAHSPQINRNAAVRVSPHSRMRIISALVILACLVFSKFLYMANISSFYTFYLIETFGVSIRDAQLYLFIFLASVAVGTFAGGPIGDRFGRQSVIWFSILGVLPFTLLLPYATLPWTIVLSIIIGLILSSAFPAIVVYAQELVPNKVGAVSGLFFGFAFGMGGLGAALLGYTADHTSIDFVYHLAAYLPAIGILTLFLPKDRKAN